MVKNTTYRGYAFSTIRRKVAFIIVGVSTAALLLVGLLVYMGQMVAFRRNLANDLVLQARVVGNNSLAAVSFNDAADALLVLQTLADQASLVYASVSRADGRVLAEYKREDFDHPPATLEDGVNYAYERNWLLVRAPITLDARTIGWVYLQSDLSELRAFRYHVVATILASLIFVFAVTALLSFKLQAFISQPIEALTGIVRDVSLRRDYAIRASITSNDEIGILAKAFNEMLGKLQLHDSQLREREKRAQEYLDVAGVMIVSVNPEGKVTLINPKGCEVLGLSEKEIIGRHWLNDFIPEHLRDSLRKRFAAWTRDGNDTIQHFESAVLQASGQERLIAWNTCAIQDAKGEAVRLLLSGEDITDQRESEEREAVLQEQLARAERMKSIGVLAGGVAHDLNNILGPLVALPEFILQDVKDNLSPRADQLDQVAKKLEMMEASALRAASVVRDLLAVSRRGHYKRVALDINKLTCMDLAAAGMSGLQAAYPHVTFTAQLSKEPLIVLGSEDHLCRVVDNLLRNAADAIEQQGTVTVKTEKRHLYLPHEGFQTVPVGEYAVLEVVDTGSGIAPEIINRILEPFYSQKQKTERSGSGLGLSIVSGIIDDHEGYLDVISAEGRGTTMCVYLRLTGAPEEKKGKEGIEPVHGSGHVLVVDDEPGQRFLASNSLRRLGYTVDLAEHGRIATQMFQKAKEDVEDLPYDLVLLDMIMEPDFDGLDTLRAIKALYPRQRVLIVSGHAENDRLAAALALDAQWLAKPYTINDLANAVAEVVGAP